MPVTRSRRAAPIPYSSSGLLLEPKLGHQLCEPLVVSGDFLAKRGMIRKGRLEADGLRGFDELLTLGCLLRRFLDNCDDIVRRTGGRRETAPHNEVYALGTRFIARGSIRQGADPCWAAHAQDFERSGFLMRNELARPLQGSINPAAEQLDRRLALVVGHVDYLVAQSEGFEERNRRQMSKGPLAGCTDAELLVGPFNVVDHILEGVPARIRPNGEGGNLHADLRDRLEGSVIEIQSAAVVGGADGVRVPNDAVASWLRGMVLR